MAQDVEMQRVEIAQQFAFQAPGPYERRAVLLKVVGSSTHLPIGMAKEVSDAINRAIVGVEVPRPQTHDLMTAMLETAQGIVERVVITRLESQTYFAEVTVRYPTETKVVDARPSDSIALALRCDAPIYVADAVLAEAGFEVEVVSGIVDAVEEDGTALVLPDGLGERGATEGSGVVAVNPEFRSALDLKAGDRVTTGVAVYPDGRRRLSLQLFETVNGRVPTTVHDLSPFGVPASLVAPSRWVAYHPTVYQPLGTDLGEATIWAGIHDTPGLTAAQVLDRVIEENVGGFKRIEDDGSFELGPGFGATALTRTTRHVEVPADSDHLMRQMFSREGATIRWIVGLAGERAVIGGFETVDWDRWGSLEPLVSEARLIATAADSGGLTAREVEVLEHIADGATNPQIAKRLDISPHTVANHVRSILAKLEAANRTQAATYAFARGIIEDVSQN